MKKTKYNVCCTEPNVQHYKQSEVEAIEFIEAVLIILNPNEIDAYLIGNALKYARRAGLKDGANWVDDARKCADYLNRYKTGEWAQ